MIIFLHIERTGGSKISRTLASEFPTQTLRIDDPAIAAAALKGTLTRADPLRVLSGHIRFAVLKNFLPPDDQANVLFTTTRDPLDRAISLYYLVLRDESTQPPLAKYAQRSFADFYSAAADYDVLAPDAQCRFIADTQSCELTWQTIQRYYHVVGNHDYYDNFLRELLSQLLHLAPGLHFDDARVNAAYHENTVNGEWRRRCSPSEIVSATTRRRIENDNANDYALIEMIHKQPDSVYRGDSSLSPGDSQ